MKTVRKTKKISKKATKSANIVSLKKARQASRGTPSVLLTDRGSINDKPKSLTLTVYETLRSEIVRCELVPGTKLRIADIALRFDVSHAAVREALSRLVAAGLLEALDQRGFRVTELSLKDLMDVTETRIEIEGLCLRKAMTNGGPEWESAVRAAYKEMSTTPVTAKNRPGLSDDHLRSHEHFHRILVVACGSDWLVNFRDRLSEQTQRYRLLSAIYEKIPRDTNKEHGDIMDAVLGRNADRAVELMTLHIRRTTDTILRAQSGKYELKRISGG